MTEIKISYVMKKETIDNSNISKFFINERDRRRVREGKVKEIVSSLQDGKHFSAPFVINEINGKWRLIDGNHRLEAIKIHLKSNKEFSIVIWMAVYRDLSPENEREVYHEWNIGTPQTATDFLKAYFNTIPLGNEMLKRLPASIYGDKDKLPIKLLIGSQINVKRRKKFEGGYSRGKEETIDDFREVTLEDIDSVFQFCKFMEQCFGKYHKDGNTQFYQSTPLSAFYRIWYDNQHIDNEKMVKSFIRVFGSSPQISKKWEIFTKSGGRSACQSFYRVAIESLNSIVKTLHFKNDDEIIEQYEKEMSIVNIVKKSKEE